MLFAKRQNLITKTGVRYVFDNPEDMFGNVDFNDEFAASPFSSEKVVVVGVGGKFDESSYDLDEVNELNFYTNCITISGNSTLTSNSSNLIGSSRNTCSNFNSIFKFYS